MIKMMLHWELKSQRLSAKKRLIAMNSARKSAVQHDGLTPHLKHDLGLEEPEENSFDYHRYL
ncbi:hypothetical protein [Photobacterium galatheae]|uniref:DUF1127 domain-containing protein n=1 Tax=Photobacterium galatheae TaxID=1654360 RepID=A0A066RWM8_9GAMM|nr:hypothetical protein [Photobacterium galatheae]KDM93516.1 hypothetical protein EA58_00065 [Photobacterium galatheae]MCM0151340.1 hypothetical protein [Photobacterium galatheae]